MTFGVTHVCISRTRMLTKWLTHLLLALVLAGTMQAGEREVAISSEDFNRLDTFEGHELTKADQAFAQKDYRSAGAAYEAFLLQYPKSPATAYAVLRKARCLHLDKKRFEAVKAYTEVLDYFPNAINYAAAALYYLGVCHAENGNLDDAMKAWTEMARDKDYRKHYLAAGALTGLAGNLLKLAKPGEAATYYEQAAVDFRKSNPEVARDAIAQALRIRILIEPNQPKLREFYEQVGTFEPDPAKPDEKNYWARIGRYLKLSGKFADTETKDRDRCYRYWAEVMAGKFPDWDDFQIDLANFRRVYENNPGQWMTRLDQQFATYQTAGDYGRIVKWIAVYAGQPKKVQEYYAKLDFAKMTNRQLQDLLRVFFDDVQDAGLARNVFGKLHLDALTDNERVQLAQYLRDRDESCVEQTCQSFTDKDRGRMELLRYYESRHNAAKGLPLAAEAVKVPATAKDAYWIKAELLQYSGKYPDAIAAYQAADNPPHNLWRIVECQLALKQLDQALKQLHEIENFFQDQAPEAALRIAHLYKDDREKCITLLRGVLTKYPKSGQSSTAYQELRAMGVPIRKGGVDAE